MNNHISNINYSPTRRERVAAVAISTIVTSVMIGFILARLAA